MSTQATKRLCAKCAAILARHNSGTVCGPCQRTEADGAVVRLREQMAERERKESERQAALMPPVKRYDKPALIAALHEMEETLGRVPIWDDCGGLWPARRTFERIFGTWTAALREAGLKRPATGRELIIEALAGGGAMTSEEIASAINVDKHRTRHLLADLHRSGIVTRTIIPRVGSHGSAPYVFTLADRAT